MIEGLRRSYVESMRSLYETVLRIYCRRTLDGILLLDKHTYRVPKASTVSKHISLHSFAVNFVNRHLEFRIFLEVVMNMVKNMTDLLIL